MYNKVCFSKIATENHVFVAIWRCVERFIDLGIIYVTTSGKWRQRHLCLLLAKF